MGMRAKVMERARGGASARNTKTRGRSVRLGMAMMGGMMVMVMGGMGLLGGLMVMGGRSGDIKDVMCMRSVIIITAGTVSSRMGTVTGGPFVRGVA